MIDDNKNTLLCGIVLLSKEVKSLKNIALNHFENVFMEDIKSVMNILKESNTPMLYLYFTKREENKVIRLMIFSTENGRDAIYYRGSIGNSKPYDDFDLKIVLNEPVLFYTNPDGIDIELDILELMDWTEGFLETMFLELDTALSYIKDNEENLHETMRIFV